jgi:hypothetical protein
MNETYQLKFERLKMNEPVSLEEINQLFSDKEKEAMMRIHNDYIIGGKNRTKYKERVEIEFPNYPPGKIEMLDSYIEFKRWFRVQSKALFRDWEREKLELKERTIKSIEEEIKDTEEKLAKELSLMKQEVYVAKLHKNRDEKRIEYEAKLRVIKEIEEEKKLEKQLEMEQKEEEYLKHCQEIKSVAVEYKQEKMTQAQEELEKIRMENKQREEENRQELLKNKPRVDEIRELGEQSAKQKYEFLEEKRNYLINREERINIAIENYSIRPQVERDPERVTQLTEAKTIAKGVIMDKADKVELFKNPGYTVENLMKDVRYKISAALSDAGLSTTTYAKALMSGLR